MLGEGASVSYLFCAYHASACRLYHESQRGFHVASRHSSQVRRVCFGRLEHFPSAHVGTIILCPHDSTHTACGHPGMTLTNVRIPHRGLNFGGGISAEPVAARNECRATLFADLGVCWAALMRELVRSARHCRATAAAGHSAHRPSGEL